MEIRIYASSFSSYSILIISEHGLGKISVKATIGFVIGTTYKSNPQTDASENKPLTFPILSTLVKRPSLIYGFTKAIGVEMFSHKYV